MIEMLSRWKPGEVIAGLAVILGCLTAIVWGVAIFWCWARRTEVRANLMRDFLQRGLAVEEIERLLRVQHDPTPAAKLVNERELEANLASLLVQYEVSAATIEQVVRVYQGTDPATKKAVYDAIEEMLESGAGEDQLLTAIRTLCLRHERAPVLPMMG
jgi:hypothetical protein